MGPTHLDLKLLLSRGFESEVFERKFETVLLAILRSSSPADARSYIGWRLTVRAVLLCWRGITPSPNPEHSKNANANANNTYIKVLLAFASCVISVSEANLHLNYPVESVDYEQ